MEYLEYLTDRNNYLAGKNLTMADLAAQPRQYAQNTFCIDVYFTDGHVCF